MTDSVGINAVTGELLTDWDHVHQSIAKLVATRIGTCVMARDLGSDVAALVDSKMTQRMVLELYRAAAEAIFAEEPRFLPRAPSITRATASGEITLSIGGIYFPRGHLGDFSSAAARIVAARLPNQLV
ncbi:GPW/gp25 family protein [Pannonibacter tanglangensis]|jgi:phage baseplate assembly protein W|uniref:Baseplate assembly protein n=1 Tax=Pannonibacter tanglangensis TaxID=2750084 RepID=A0ABW9ZD63_9HYPH|nr:GPW/gp25 family protein [Pannonibacter sp. XCT-34]NBN62785.1 baseplate assembly protein [Pannonibacter sp. XCT-34]